jgi:hypothetical protein
MVLRSGVFAAAAVLFGAVTPLIRIASHLSAMQAKLGEFLRHI